VKAAVLALTLAFAPSAVVDPVVLQNRYDAARDAEERALSTHDARGAARARAGVRAVEAADTRPSGWHLSREVPAFVPPALARAERTRDVRLARELANVGASYRGWAGFWVQDLRTGSWAGWNSDARFPAASTVKLGVLAAALRAHGPASPLWYDLRQLTGWSSNLAANRVTRKLGGERVVESALRRVGARSSTYPGPYRAGTAVLSDAPKPPPQRHWRVTTAHDLGRVLYAFQAAAAGNRYVQRQTGLSRARARLAIGLLASAWTRGDHAGLVQPFTRARVAHKEGWISDTRATAAVVYGSSPKIVVVLVYRPKVTLAEARALSRRVVRLALQ
jgi:beta-lactamase class A